MKAKTVSEKHTASIFKAKDYAKQETSMSRQQQSVFLHVVHFACYLLHDGFLFGLLFDPQDGSNMFL
jgi:hypothetical protein